MKMVWWVQNVWSDGSRMYGLMGPECMVWWVQNVWSDGSRMYGGNDLRNLRPNLRPNFGLRPNALLSILGVVSYKKKSYRDIHSILSRYCRPWLHGFMQWLYSYWVGHAARATATTHGACVLCTMHRLNETSSRLLWPHCILPHCSTIVWKWN